MAERSNPMLGWAVGLALLAGVTHSCLNQPKGASEGAPEVASGYSSDTSADTVADTTADLAAARGIDPPLLYSGQTYRGAGCTDDCSGHEAGYEWAELHGIEDPDDCGGNSYSFIEGCVLYAQERAEEADPSGDEEEDQE